MNISFAGCGFLGIYHIGVAVCLKTHAPNLPFHKISGASAGAIAACCLLCDIPMGEVASDMLKLITEAGKRTLGPFSPTFNVQTRLYDVLDRVLPNDAHLKVNRKLHVSLTRVYDRKNVMISEFSTREDLLQVILASSFVPVFSGLLPPKYRGIRYMDGGFSNNLPIIDQDTVTVSPFSGESDICPRDISSQLFHVQLANTSIELSKQNVHRFIKILWPPDAEVLSNLCNQGFDDALKFIHKINLIYCSKCMPGDPGFPKPGNEEAAECFDCVAHKKETLTSHLPEQVVGIFRRASFTRRSLLIKNSGFRRFISILNLPIILPFEMTVTLIKKVKSLVFIIFRPFLFIFDRERTKY